MGFWKSRTRDNEPTHQLIVRYDPPEVINSIDNNRAIYLACQEALRYALEDNDKLHVSTPAPQQSTPNISHESIEWGNIGAGNELIFVRNFVRPNKTIEELKIFGEFAKQFASMIAAIANQNKIEFDPMFLSVTAKEIPRGQAK